MSGTISDVGAHPVGEAPPEAIDQDKGAKKGDGEGNQNGVRFTYLTDKVRRRTGSRERVCFLSVGK